jgi:mannose-6-phosphate isomerase-like protein (cupin superfamily)
MSTRKKPSKAWVMHLEKSTLANENFRTVFQTTGHLQVVLMTLQAGEDIGMEVHQGNDQFFRLEEGLLLVTIDGKDHYLGPGDAIIVSQGSLHNVTAMVKSKLYTIYSPPNHPSDRVDKYKPRE